VVEKDSPSPSLWIVQQPPVGSTRGLRSRAAYEARLRWEEPSAHQVKSVAFTAVTEVMPGQRTSILKRYGQPHEVQVKCKALIPLSMIHPTETCFDL
jgi:hypothetical protein